MGRAHAYPRLGVYRALGGRGRPRAVPLYDLRRSCLLYTSAAAARLATGRGALTAAFTTTPGSALEQAADHIVYYFDDPASPYPAVLTIFPEVYKLTYALLDVWKMCIRDRHRSVCFAHAQPRKRRL